MTTEARRSPKILHLSWGKMDIEGVGPGRDFMLWPGGGREWDWKLSNTHHVPGIQFADVETLLVHGAEVIVLSRGMDLVLQTAPETKRALEERGIEHYIEETRAAAERYNRLAEEGVKVGGLFHSTC